MSTSHGRYAGQVAIPLLLDMLRRQEVRATFFVPAWSAGQHLNAMRAITADGHEVGCHGDVHERLEGMPREEETRVLQRSMAVLEEITVPATDG